MFIYIILVFLLIKKGALMPIYLNPFRYIYILVTDKVSFYFFRCQRNIIAPFSI